jgi:hypothetical protein
VKLPFFCAEKFLFLASRHVKKMPFQRPLVNIILYEYMNILLTFMVFIEQLGVSEKADHVICYM